MNAQDRVGFARNRLARAESRNQLATWWGRTKRWWRRFAVYNEVEDVRDFHLKFGLLAHDSPVHLTRRKLQERVEFMQEELNEFAAAVNTQNLAEQADALIDLVYVAKGTAVMLGLPWDQLWEDVQRANLQKVRGVTHRGHAVDVRKPLDWQPPRPEFVLMLHGYDRIEWVDADEAVGTFGDVPIDERHCAEDGHAL